MCTDTVACNYDTNATDSDDSCTYPTEIYLDCNDNCLNDEDSDGVCDEVEVIGCVDSSAINYSDVATDDDGSCIYAILGCTNSNYYNYDAEAEEDDGSCINKIGDANGDDSVNLTDLFLVLDNWLEVSEVGDDGDVNQDGIINLTDLFDVLDNWLQ